MKRLFRSLIDFNDMSASALRPHFAQMAHSQTPEVLMIACSDSRVSPHLLASSGPGELFEVRTVGNLIAPAESNGVSVGDFSEAAAIEYALEVLGVRDIAVCGHSNCGAMRALLKGRAALKAGTPNLCEWLAHGDPSLRRHTSGELADSGRAPEDMLSQVNVLQQLAHIATYPSVKRLIAAGELRLHGLWFDIQRAEVSLFEADRNAFVPVDTTEMVRLIDAEGVAERSTLTLAAQEKR